MSNKRIFFFGELPPKTIHGASISNQININILKKDFDLDYIEEYSDLKYHGKFSLSKMRQFLSSVLDSWALFAKRKYDFYYGVIYLSSFGMIKNLLLVSVFKLFNLQGKVILHFHRGDLDCFFRRKMNRILFKSLNAMTDTFIVLAQKQIKEVQEHTNRRIEILYNTIEENSLNFSRPLRKKTRIKLLFLSNFIKEKGFFDLIEAQKQITNLYPDTFELNCYGEFANSNQKEDVLSNIKEFDITINSRIYGDEKSQVLNEADVVILPSYNEGLPLILLEALYLGKPVIISNVGYISEILGYDYPLYCEPKNIESILNCIINFKDKYQIKEFADSLRLKYSKFSLETHKRNLKLFFS